MGVNPGVSYDEGKSSLEGNDIQRYNEGKTASYQQKYNTPEVLWGSK